MLVVHEEFRFPPFLQPFAFHLYTHPCDTLSTKYFESEYIVTAHLGLRTFSAAIAAQISMRLLVVNRNPSDSSCSCGRMKGQPRSRQVPDYRYKLHLCTRQLLSFHFLPRIITDKGNYRTNLSQLNPFLYTFNHSMKNRIYPENHPNSNKSKNSKYQRTTRLPPVPQLHTPLPSKQ